LYQDHLEQAAEARKKYYKHNEKARTNPDKYMSTIFDGMTQATTALVRSSQKPKWITNKTKLAVHNMGAMTEGYHAAMELSTENISNNANALVDCLQRAISRV
jgi:hypothetical protein